MRILKRPEGKPVGPFNGGPACIHFSFNENLSIGNIEKAAIPAISLYVATEYPNANAVMLGGYFTHLPTGADTEIGVHMAIQLYQM